MCVLHSHGQLQAHSLSISIAWCVVDECSGGSVHVKQYGHYSLLSLGQATAMLSVEMMTMIGLALVGNSLFVICQVGLSRLDAA